MKVLAGPRLDLDPRGSAVRVCAALAGDRGEVVSLAALGLRNPYRGLSAAEVDALRAVLRDQTGTVGLVCSGAGTGPVERARQPLSGPGAPLPGLAGTSAPPRAVIVTDHVNLTWRSPLSGPNDDAIGPRFPSMDGVYAPDAVAGLSSAFDGMIVSRGVVAGVPDDRAPSDYESEMASRFGWAAVSSELVAPVIVAAHMGLRVAAVVLLT